MTFYTINQTTIKELNLGRYILNKLSSGKDIFKLIIEKPKIKRSKDKDKILIIIKFFIYKLIIIFQKF